MASSNLAGFFAANGILFDFYQPDFYRAKYQDILKRFLVDWNDGAIAGGYFTKYQPTKQAHEQDINIYVFIQASHTAEHAHSSLERATELNNFLVDDCRQFAFIPNPYSQRDCETSIKEFYSSTNFSSPLTYSATKSVDCPQKISIRFTTAKDIVTLINNFDYEPCKIAYRRGRMYFGSWYTTGGQMSARKPELIENVFIKVLNIKYARKGFTEVFNTALVNDINQLVD